MRLLHTMLRVGELESSIQFYWDVLGMTLLRREDFPTGKFTLVFVGYGDESDHTVIELTTIHFYQYFSSGARCESTWTDPRLL